MSRRKPRPPRRETPAFANRPPRQDVYLSPPDEVLIRPLPSVFPSVIRASIPEIADDRTWNPDEGSRSGRSSRRLNPTYHRAKSTKATRGHSYELNFVAPKYVVHCVRRHRRKEVLFALGKTGKGAKQKRRRRNMWSSVRC